MSRKLRRSSSFHLSSSILLFVPDLLRQTSSRKTTATCFLKRTGVQYQQTFCASNNYQKGACDDPATGKPNPALAGDLAPGAFVLVV
eukprot:COSAG06_NODE_6149_length_3084_cov_3.104188_1_plen_86_part_10